MFVLVLLQLMIMPDVLIIENYRTLNAMGLIDTTVAIGMPYFGSALGIFLMRPRPSSRFPGSSTTPPASRAQARCSRCSKSTCLSRSPLAYGLVSVSYQWTNLLWPLIVTNSVGSRPLTVGLQIFSSGDQGIDRSIITAATLLSAGPLLVAVLLFQRQFVAVVSQGRHPLRTLTGGDARIAATKRSHPWRHVRRRCAAATWGSPWHRVGSTRWRIARSARVKVPSVLSQIMSRGHPRSASC